MENRFIYLLYQVLSDLCLIGTGEVGCLLVRSGVRAVGVR